MKEGKVVDIRNEGDYRIVLIRTKEMELIRIMDHEEKFELDKRFKFSFSASRLKGKILEITGISDISRID